MLDDLGLGAYHQVASIQGAQRRPSGFFPRLWVFIGELLHHLNGDDFPSYATIGLKVP